MDDWQGIFDRHGDDAWQTAYRLLWSSADASDCVQEAFVRAWQLSRRGPIANWGGLLRRLVVGKAIDCLRRRERRRFRERPIPETQPAADSASPQAAAAQVELADALRRALATIPRRQAEVFVQSQILGLPHAQIAQDMRLRENHVGVLVWRARKRLQDHLRPFHPVNPS